MVVEYLTIRESTGIREVSGEVYVSEGATSDVAVVEEVKVVLEPSAVIVIQQLGVMGGSPVIGGTRIHVSDVIRHQTLRGESIADIRRALPHLTQDQIGAALQYYGEHRAEIDTEIESERGLAASAGDNPSG